MKNLIIILFLLNFTALQVYSKHVNPDVRRGNREYKAENFTEAEKNYRRALEEDSQSLKALYNLANALYKQGRYDEAANILDGISNLNIPDHRRADVYHNLGNARIGNQQIQEGIESYKNSLRLRPDDNDTRHNLAMAMRLLQEQEQEQQQQQDQDQEQDGEDDQQQDQQQQDEQEQEQEQEQESQPRPDQISPEDAQRILDALNQQEQEIQEKIEREDRQRRPERPLREW